MAKTNVNSVADYNCDWCVIAKAEGAPTNPYKQLVLKGKPSAGNMRGEKHWDVCDDCIIGLGVGPITQAVQELS